MSQLLTRPFVHQLFPPFQTFSLTIQLFYSHSIFYSHFIFLLPFQCYYHLNFPSVSISLSFELFHSLHNWCCNTCQYTAIYMSIASCCFVSTFLGGVGCPMLVESSSYCAILHLCSLLLSFLQVDFFGVTTIHVLSLHIL